MKLILLLILISVSLYSQIIITEIMYDLVGSDSPNEFVEILNISETDTTDMTGWQIRDQSSADTLVDSGWGLILLPMQYGIIFEGDYNFQNGIYVDYLPDDAVLIKVANTTIGNNLNNTNGDSLYLINTIGHVIDSVGYDDIAQDGFSIEKIRLNHPNTPSNWTTSVDSLGTPGLPNSVLPLSIDGNLLTDSLQTHPQIIEQNETTTITGAVVNIGSESFSAEIFIRENDIIISSISLGTMVELDTLSFSISVGPFTSGTHQLDVVLEISGDQDTTNNNGIVNINERYEPSLLMINEFLPRPESDQCEFIELVYHGSISLNIQDWRVTDENIGSNYTLPAFTIEQSDLIVIARDSTLLNIVPTNVLYIVPQGGFPVLNNAGDEIRIFDPFDTLIDSLYYTEDWGYMDGISMEKILPAYQSEDPVSWKPCTDDFGITPGAENSVTPLDVDGAIITDSIIHEPEFPQHDQNVTILIPIANVGLSTISGIITIEDNDEEISTTSIPPITSGDTTIVDVTLQPLSSGIHPLTIILDIPLDSNPENDVAADTVKVSYPFGSVVINEFLAQPDSTQVEFVEVVSMITVNIENWAISDNTKSLKLFPVIHVLGNDFIVVSEDSSLLARLPLEGNLAVPKSGFPVLNNTSDGIYIYDMTGFIVDSLLYSEEWPVTDGRSSEKFRPEFVSNDSSKWGVAVNLGAMTPGDTNSIFFEEIPKEGTVIYEPNPFSPDNDGFDDVLQIKYKLPFEQAISKVEIFDVVGRSIDTPYWNLHVAQEGILSWFGNRKNGEPARIGIYIIKFTAKNPATGKTWENVQTVVLAKKL